MSVESMLDVVCFQNSHTHIQPIVLVERLPEPEEPVLHVNGLHVNGLHMNGLHVNDCLPPKIRHRVNHSPRGPRRRNLIKSSHVMRLRSRNSVKTAAVPTARPNNSRSAFRVNSSRPTTARLTTSRASSTRPSTSRPTTSRSTSSRSVTTSGMASRANSFGSFIALPRQRTRKSQQVEFNKPLPLKRKCVQPKYTRPSSEFSLDDNRPLKYFARCSTPLHSQSIMSPMTIASRLSSVPYETDKSELKLSLSAASMSDTIARPKLAEVVPNGSPGTETPETPVDSILKRNLNGYKFGSGDALPAQSADVAAEEPSDLYSSTRPVSYYSEQGIHRWMDGSLSEQGMSSTRARTADSMQDTIIIEDDEIKLEYEDSYPCPSYAWRTVNDVVNLSKAQYAAKCSECTNCERIQKFERICGLLKNKFNIKDNVDNMWAESEALNWNPICMQKELFARDLEGGGVIRQEGTENIYMDMIPRHPHIMIKCVKQIVDGQQVLYTRLIPRSRADNSVEFSFTDHEFILDKLIEKLDPNMKNDLLRGLFLDQEAVNDPELESEIEPVAGPSGIQQENIKPQILEIDEDMDDVCVNDKGKILNAPTYHPTQEEFSDPMEYFEKIKEQASEFGICKIVPPDGFAPTCKIDDEIKFEVFNQYISRLYNRWGPSARELCAIRTCLKEQNVNASRPAMIDGVEVNLPKLYHLVQRYGGLENVINKNRWCKVAEDMNLNKGPSTERKLDQIYVTFLLPYDTMTPSERQDLSLRVEKAWNKRNNKMLERANNPLHCQKRLLGESDASSDESDDDATKDAEDCVEPGQNMNLGKFKRVAKNAQLQFFGNRAAHPVQVEDEYWRMVILGNEHICVNTASIDTGEQKLGFSISKIDGYSNHKWNLKMLSQNKLNVLRSLGPVLGVTVPTLHLGMIFSTSCWHRDPHAVPWVEFSHMGPAKIWYSVPEKEDSNFRTASKFLNPTSCQNKEIWLSSDISMIPPNLLRQHNVKVYRVEQNPGEYVLVMPRAYSCSISTGYTVSESVYFATESLLDGLINAFQEIRKSCEPTMFALEQLLKAIAEDRTTSQSVLRKIQPVLEKIFNEEIDNRKRLESKILSVVKPINEDDTTTLKGKKSKSASSKPTVWNVRDQDECDICRCTLYLSKVKNISQNSFLCLEHILKLINNKKKTPAINLLDLELHYIIDTDDLNKVIANLRDRIQQAITAR